MQAIMETLFDAVYLITVITLGIIMITKSKERKELVSFVRLTNVDESQHHHNEGLKQHDKNME